MKKIVVDSSCDFLEVFEQENFTKIERVPFLLYLDGKEFIDNDTLDPVDFLVDMENSKTASKSAAPSPEAFMTAYGDETEEVFVFTLSSKLSGAYSSAMLGKELCLEKYPNKKIHVFDDMTGTAGTTLCAVEVDELIRSGLEFEEIVEKMEAKLRELDLYFILESYGNLVKNGRMNPLMAKVAGVLNIRPVCYVKEGVIELFEKARGQKAYDRLVALMAEAAKNRNSVRVVITHVQCSARAQSLKEKILATVNAKEVLIAKPTSLCTNYGERGGVMIAFM